MLGITWKEAENRTPDTIMPLSKPRVKSYFEIIVYNSGHNT